MLLSSLLGKEEEEEGGGGNDGGCPAFSNHLLAQLYLTLLGSLGTILFGSFVKLLKWCLSITSTGINNHIRDGIR